MASVDLRRSVAAPRALIAPFAPLAPLALLALLAAAVSGGFAATGCAILQRDARPPLSVEHQRLERLAQDFYSRLGNRRVDSIAAYRDPGLHEFFRSEGDFADYYASLVRELSDAHFEANRPTAIDLDAVRPVEDGRVEIDLRLFGRNGRPLRWWRARIRRTDTWERGPADTWIIRPGKV